MAQNEGIDYDELAAALVQALNQPGAFSVSRPVDGGRTRVTQTDRIQWLPLATDGEYANYRIQADLNHPYALFDDLLSSKDQTRFFTAMSKVVLAQEGWPVESMDALWNTISEAEVLLVLKAIRVAKRRRLNLLMEFAPD